MDECEPLITGMKEHPWFLKNLPAELANAVDNDGKARISSTRLILSLSHLFVLPQGCIW